MKIYPQAAKVRASDKMSADFQIFVDELKTIKLRDEEAIRDAVKVKVLPDQEGICPLLDHEHRGGVL